MKYLLIILCVFLTAYGQLVFKWRINSLGQTQSKFSLFSVLLDPYILSGYGAAFLTSIFWIFVIKKFDLVYAYAFMALPFVLVPLASSFLLGERLNSVSLLGYALIMGGVCCVGCSK